MLPTGLLRKQTAVTTAAHSIRINNISNKQTKATVEQKMNEKRYHQTTQTHLQISAE